MATTQTDAAYQQASLADNMPSFSTPDIFFSDEDIEDLPDEIDGLP